MARSIFVPLQRKTCCRSDRIAAKPWLSGTSQLPHFGIFWSLFKGVIAQEASGCCKSAWPKEDATVVVERGTAIEENLSTIYKAG
jgi:hypothetical protein